MTRTTFCLITFSLLLGVNLAKAQPATPEQRAGVQEIEGKKTATLHFRTNLGSFKFLNGFGRIEVSFTGTLLISKLEGTHQIVSGQLKKEFEDKGRIVYFGTGRMVISGKFRAVQWFGRNMSGTWFGNGVARFVGEFDQNLNTGEYWFDDPNKKQFWSSQGIITVFLPQPDYTGTRDVVPVERPKGKSK